MSKKYKVVGWTIGAGIGIGVLYYLVKKTAAAEGKLLTLTIKYNSVDGCASGAPITFEGRYTIGGRGIDGTEIWIRNEDTGDLFGPATARNGGFYSFDATAPVVTTSTTFKYRAYTADQLSASITPS